ncbi:MAG: hypothetical protein QOF82_633 [Frankiales bacterium]|jgi:hypothetical protein|nr:hypothetical protein [Frankiales bacterium]
MDQSYRQLLSQQKGLLTAQQAIALGIDDAAIHRRTRGERPRWRRVAPRVYATFLHPLTFQQKVIVAWLYAGDGAVLTGAASLHWLGMLYLPTEVKALPVDVLLPADRECKGTELVRVQRTIRMPSAVNVDHVHCAPVYRAVADCARRLRTYSGVLGLLTCALNSGQVTLQALALELAEGPVRGSRQLRRALVEASFDIRSVPEAELLRLVAHAGLPAPLVNVAIMVDGRRFIPDFRWGMVIVEVDSHLHHVLRPGGPAATERRRLILQAAGYHVIPVTPEQIRQRPAEVIQDIVAALQASGAM